MELCTDDLAIWYVRVYRERYRKALYAERPWKSTMPRQAFAQAAAAVRAGILQEVLEETGPDAALQVGAILDRHFGGLQGELELGDAEAGAYRRSGA